MEIIEIKKKFHTELLEIYPREEIDAFFYLLTESFISKTRLDLALDLKFKVSRTIEKRFIHALTELKREYPIQYIIGSTEFFGLPFIVNKHTLIPRPETEDLVDWILSDIAVNRILAPKIIDVGTGSGCIAIALAANLGDSTITALDKSEKALETAKLNAKRNKVNVEFRCADILTTKQLPNNYDIIVSNPPYVRYSEMNRMSKNVLDYEPASALFVTDQEPLIFYEKIAKLALKALNPKGILYFEINEYLGNELVSTMKNLGFDDVELRQDVFGKYRMIKLQRHE